MNDGPSFQVPSASTFQGISTRCTGSPHSRQGGEARLTSSALSMASLSVVVIPFLGWINDHRYVSFLPWTFGQDSRSLKGREAEFDVLKFGLASGWRKSGVGPGI